MGKKKNLLIIILTIAVVLLLGVLAYLLFCDKKAELKCEDNPKVTEKECNCSSVCLGEKITSVKEIKITETNQEIKIGRKTFKVRVDESKKLYVDDHISVGGQYADYMYLTDKYAFFTVASQFNYSISYAFSENEIITVNNNGSLMKDFKVVDGYLNATGGREIGFETWDQKDLLIKYIDNTLIVTYAK